jgi:ketosteroid isomerase-like protein
MIHATRLIERRFREKSHTIIRALTVLSLAAIAAGIGLFLIPLPAEGQTGKSLSEADLKKIDEATQTAMNAAVARDFATWAALFLDDAVINPANEPAVKGRVAIRAWLEKFHTPPGAPGPVKDSGKFVTVVRKQRDGRWLGAVDMFSSDLPPPPPPPPK